MRHVFGALAVAGACFALSACGGGSTPSAGGSPDAPPDGALGVDRRAGWCWQDTLATGGELRAAAFIDAQHGWAVGDHGLLLTTADGGATWSAGTVDASHDFWTVNFLDARNGWAATYDGWVARSTDGGATWAGTQVDGLAGPALVPLDASRVVAMAYGGGTLSIDGGASFADMPGLDGSGPMHIAAVSAASGDCWSLDPEPIRLPHCERAQAVVVTPEADARYWSVSSDDGVDVLLQGGIGSQASTWHSTDAGVHWTRSGQQSDVSIVELLHFDGRAAWASAGYEVGVPSWYRTTDAGATWRRVAFPAAITANDSSYTARAGTVDSATAWAVLRNHVAITRDGGASWVEGTLDDIGDYAASRLVSIHGQSLVFQIGTRLHRSIDGGRSWNRIAGPVPANVHESVRSLWFGDASNGLALLSDGGFLRTDDGGRRWVAQPAPGAASGYGNPMRFASTGLGWAFLGDVLMRSTDAGRTWSAVPGQAADNGPAEAFDLLADGLHGWTVSRGRTRATSDAGATWRVVGDAPVPMCQCELRFADASNGLLASAQGDVWRTTDGGATWTAVAVPAGTVVRAIAWISPQVAWMVGSNGGAGQVALESSDGGATWRSVDLGGEGSLSDVRFTDALHGWIVGSGTILRTDDGGAGWQRQDLAPAALGAAFFLDASTGWIGAGDGRILATSTGGR